MAGDSSGVSKWIGAPFGALAVLLGGHERQKCVWEHAVACVCGQQSGGLRQNVAVPRSTAWVLELRQPDTVSGNDDDHDVMGHRELIDSHLMTEWW